MTLSIFFYPVNTEILTLFFKTYSTYYFVTWFFHRICLCDFSISVPISLVLSLHYSPITVLFHCFQVFASTNSVTMNNIHILVCIGTAHYSHEFDKNLLINTSSLEVFPLLKHIFNLLSNFFWGRGLIERNQYRLDMEEQERCCF